MRPCPARPPIPRGLHVSVASLAGRGKWHHTTKAPSFGTGNRLGTPERHMDAFNDFIADHEPALRLGCFLAVLAVMAGAEALWPRRPGASLRMM